MTTDIKLTTNDNLAHEDEIDLAELAANLWSRKLLIFVSTTFCVFLAVLYSSFVVVPTYEAKSRFELNEASTENFGDLGGLASLAGINLDRGRVSEVEKVEDRIFSRPFINQISIAASLYEDPQFNKTLQPKGYFQQLVESFSDNSGADPTIAEIDRSINNSFFDSVALTVQKNGILELSVTHSDPDNAATIANLIVQNVLQNFREMQREQTRARIDYFADQLLQARTELDRSTQSLSEYSLANNLRSQEELARSSAQLVSLRERYSELGLRYNAIQQLFEFSRDGKAFDDTTRETFLRNFSAAASLDFRQAVGWSGPESTWSLPLNNDIVSYIQILSEQRTTLERTIEELERNAMRSAEAAIELEGLRREISVNEAIYEAMLKQFESESLVFGFATEGGEIIETAVPPLDPSTPRKALAAAIGMVLGLFLGIGIAIFSSMRRGLLFTTNSIIQSIMIPTAAIISSSIKKFTIKDLNFSSRNLNSKTIRQLDDFFLQIGSENCAHIAVLPTTADRLSFGSALMVASVSRLRHGTVCIVDLSASDDLWGNSRTPVNSDPVKLADEIFLVKPTLGDRASRSGAAAAAINTIAERFDCIIILCPVPEHGVALSMQALDCVKTAIVIARRGRVTRDDAQRIFGLLSKDAQKHLGIIIA